MKRRTLMESHETTEIDPGRLAAALEQQFMVESLPSHPDDEELFAFVDGTLSNPELEIVESHLEDCRLCRADVEDLRRLKPRARVRWMFAAAAAIVIAALSVLLIPNRTVPPPEGVRRAVLKARPVQAAPAAHGRWSALVDATLAHGMQRPAILDQGQFEGESLRGDAPSSAGHVIAPIGTVIDDARPAFRWSSSITAPVVVYVFRDHDEVARSPRLTASQWQCDRDLPRGATYSWQVAIHQGIEERIIPAPPQPPADFHVLGEKEHAEISEAKRLFPDDSLLHGILYARSGVLGTAEKEIERYAALHPESEDVERLLHLIRAWTNNRT